MGLFSKKPPVKPGFVVMSDEVAGVGVDPLPASTTLDEIVDHMSRDYFDEADPHKRGEYTNGALAWAEVYETPAVFEHLQEVIMTLEIARYAKAWNSETGEDFELASAKLQTVLAMMAEECAEPPPGGNDPYWICFAGDIPEIVDMMYRNLVAQR